jgi:ubiquinol oxidase
MSTLPEKKDHQSEENKNENNSDRINNNAVVSSYWGIARPKVLKEDGTEWPWNCFMVRILIYQS